MKKVYINLEMTIVKVFVSNQLLATSTDPATITMGGSADNTAAYGRDFDFDDED